MNRQLDLFIAELETPLGGLRVKLDRLVDRDRSCCRNLCTLALRNGPNAVALVCIDCGQNRGWLAKTTALWIEDVVAHFGAPTTPIVVRTSNTYEEEALTDKD